MKDHSNYTLRNLENQVNQVLNDEYRQRHNRVLEALASAGYVVQFGTYRDYPMRRIVQGGQA